MLIRRLAIIGVGLIGGSLARALRRANACAEVVGVGRNAERLQTAVELGVVDRFSTDLAEGVAGADMVVVAVPMLTMEKVFAAIRDHLADDAILTDVGSSKAKIISVAEHVFGEIPSFLVPGHPIAGTEQSGVEASFPELFDQRRVILTPTAKSATSAVEKVRKMWELAGAHVVEMDAERHDRILAATSHLPHVLAFTLVDALERQDEHKEIFQNAAGGFRDFTRISSSDPVMWRDICLANHSAVLETMERYIQELQTVASMIRQSDGDALEALFRRAKEARDRIYL